MSDPAAGRIIGLYGDKAEGWIADRGRELFRGRGGPTRSPGEGVWLARRPLTRG